MLGLEAVVLGGGGGLDDVVATHDAHERLGAPQGGPTTQSATVVLTAQELPERDSIVFKLVIAVVDRAVATHVAQDRLEAPQGGPTTQSATVVLTAQELPKRDSIVLSVVMAVVEALDGAATELEVETSSESSVSV